DYGHLSMCAHKRLIGCNKRLDTWPVMLKLKSAMKKVEYPESCGDDYDNVDVGDDDNHDEDDDDKDDEKDSVTSDIEECLSRFAQSLDAVGSLKGLMMAANELQECLFNLDPAFTLHLDSAQKLVLENVNILIDIIIENNMTLSGDAGDGDLIQFLPSPYPIAPPLPPTFLDRFISPLFTVTHPVLAAVSSDCEEALNHLATRHWIDALLLPATPTRSRPYLCQALQYDTHKVLSSYCKNETDYGKEYVEAAYKLIDVVREKFLISFCPEAYPIPRCLVRKVEQCMDRFSAYVGPIGDGNICLEARSLLHCVKTYATRCDDEKVFSLIKRSAFFVDTISQACYMDSTLVSEARCLLTARVDSSIGCNMYGIGHCDLNESEENCRATEEKAACFIEGAGSCLGSVSSALLDSFAQRVAECRPGNMTSKGDLFQPCGKKPYRCNITGAAECMYKLVESQSTGDNQTESIKMAKACLEKEFYCFSPVITLLAKNIDEFASLVVRVLDLTPDWSKMDSTKLINLLTLPSYITNVLQMTPPVSLNLWDICWDLDNALGKLESFKENFPDLDLAAFQDTTESLQFTIQSLCNDFGQVAQNLEFPSDGENPTCAAPAIKARINILMARGIAEFYTQKQIGAQSVLENPTCAAPAIKARINILMARGIAEFYTHKQIGAQSVCMELYNLKSALAEADGVFSLVDCSSGFTEKVNFTLRAIQSVIRTRCESDQLGGIRRCDLGITGYCIGNLYSQFMTLGYYRTIPNICSELENTEYCVKKFSYKCDSTQLGALHWMWRSVKRPIESLCEQEKPSPVCEEEEDDNDSDGPPCNMRKAKKCAGKKFSDSLNPFASKKKRCRSLKKNMKCIEKYSKKCDASELSYKLDAEAMEDLQEKLGCEKDEQEETFGCRKGCMLEEAHKCFEYFEKRISRSMYGILTTKSCRLINDLRFCVAKHTMSCKRKESRAVEKALDYLLDDFPEHETACVDVVSCSADFDMLVRQIEGMELEGNSMGYEDMYGDGKDWSEDKNNMGKGEGKDDKYEKDDKDDKNEKDDKDEKGSMKDKDDKYEKDDKDDKSEGGDKGDKGDSKDNAGKKDKDDKDDERKSDDMDGGYDKGGEGMGSAEPSLAALCNRIHHIWTSCLQPGLRLLPPSKQETARAFYEALWVNVAEKCSDTVNLRCYQCRNETEPAECEKVEETCPYNEKVCMLQTVLEDRKLYFSASCAQPEKCRSDGDSNKQRSCCYGDMCNTASDVSENPVQLDPVSCKIDYALQCALEFTATYISTEEIDCEGSTLLLGCVQRHAQTCTSAFSKSLLEVTNSLYLELARTSCVVDAEPGDCFSLAIFSMQSILSNAYISDGNAPCVGLEQTEQSVQQTIDSGTCSEAGRIGLESALQFVRSIVGPYCEEGTCEAIDWSDVIGGDAVCSEQIFKGIKNIYRGYAELKKNETDCGMASSYSYQARQLLNNCNMVPFVESKLESLETKVEATCPKADTSELPPICAGQCQTDVVIEYVRSVRDLFDTSSVKSGTVCSTLTQVENVYKVYTRDCTSIQQGDVVENIEFTLNQEIERCVEQGAFSGLELPIKRDIYYDVIICQMTFQEELEASFIDADEERFCRAVVDLEQCDYDLPVVFEDFITGPTKDLLALIETAGLCAEDPGSSIPIEKRKKREVCDVERLSSLLKQLSIPPSIATSSFESRDLLCQETVAALQEADGLIQGSCSSTLNRFQVLLYAVVKRNVEENNKKLCVPLRFEEEGCDLQKVDSCFRNFFTVLEFIKIEPDSVCRQARFALECLNRFTENCTGADLSAANEINSDAIQLMKGVVSNECPGLTKHLYCKTPLSDTTPACRFEEATSCSAAAEPDPTEPFSEEYCQTLEDNVQCTKRSLSGCEPAQLAEVSLPADDLNNLCALTDLDFDDVCTSEPPCPEDMYWKCFDDIGDCSQLVSAITCANDISDNNSNCKDLIGHNIFQNYLVDYYKAAILSVGCGSITRTLFALGDRTCVYVVEDTVSDALTYAKGTPDGFLRYVLNTVQNCVDSNDNVFTEGVGQIIDALNGTIDPNVAAIEYSAADNGTCVYSRAVACVGLQITRLFNIKLINFGEREQVCKAYSENTVVDCLDEALVECSDDRKPWFANINNRMNKAIEDLGLCQAPQTCVVSEAFACINKFGSDISEYDRTRDKQKLCLQRVKTESCIDGFIFECEKAQSDSVMKSYYDLTSKVNVERICEGVELPPPPICPDLPEKSRVCYLGNAFRCLFTFSINILQGDTLIWRQQCMTIQKMMTCVARSTSGCNVTDPDVMQIRGLLEEFVDKAGDHCPWLSENLCLEEKPCPVTTAGCEVELAQGLINRKTDVCTLKKMADECVVNNTKTCTRAQRNQAYSVMERKLQATGLPSVLLCTSGSIDGPLYSFLVGSGDISVESRRAAACSKYQDLYNTVNTQYSNPRSEPFVSLAKTLIDGLYVERQKVCDGNASSECSDEFPVKDFATFITDLLLKPDLSNVSFCAQANALMSKQGSCSASIFNDILTSPVYNERCRDVISCAVDTISNINECVRTIGNISEMDCGEIQRAAACVTRLLPPNCPYVSTWHEGRLCPDTVVLRATHTLKRKQFISETGLAATYGWQVVEGSRNFSIKIETITLDADKVPREMQRAAACVTRLLPPDCPYVSTWHEGRLCPDTVVLRATHTLKRKQFISETGLAATYGWQIAEGSRNFSIKIETITLDADKVPRCLKGSKVNEPIAQAYTGPTVKSLGEREEDTIEFKVYAREDYKRDGPQAIDVQFTISPGTLIVNNDGNIEISPADPSRAFSPPTTRVYIDDRSIPNSVCSSINDPHLRTHDNMKYNNMEVGKFILFRHTKFAEAVVVQYSQCAKYGSCNCGVRVYAGKSRVTFDLCDQNTDLVSYYTETGADALAQQRMVVLMEKDLKTYHVILLDSGTLVKVRIEGMYMNIWVVPSAKDIGATQGLCGVYDGDGYNDFQLPDGSLYEATEADGVSGVLAPTVFNYLWMIQGDQYDDYTQVFYPNVTINTDAVPTYCHTWYQRSGDEAVTMCNKWAHLAACGLVNGEDQTESLLANFKQESQVVPLPVPIRKRQASVDDEVPPTGQNADWPTLSGWTFESASAYCLDNLGDDTLRKCVEAVASLNGTMQGFTLDDEPGDFSVYDDCLYCDLQNPTEWTIRKEVQRCREKHADSDDSDDMLIPLVGTGCALLLLLIILVIGLIVFLRRRDAAKKRESRQTKGHSNLAYHGSDGVPFDGSPVLHMNVREDAPSNNLTASNYPEEA
ncbi:von Willebrand factor d and egf domain-containing protein, partial [Plakobranchus ocellatus]